MPHFLFKKPKSFSVNFTEIEDTPSLDPPFWEVQRADALNILTTFFSTWQTLWKETINSLGKLTISEEGARRLVYYENEQKQTVTGYLADILIAWEKDDSASFSEAIISLAKELRPSLMHFETAADDNFELSSDQIQIIKNYTKNVAIALKSSIEELQRLSLKKFEFGDKVLTHSQARSLIEEKLNLNYYEFLDFATDPEFASGFLPELLQESTDFGF